MCCSNFVRLGASNIKTITYGKIGKYGKFYCLSFMPILGACVNAISDCYLFYSSLQFTDMHAVLEIEKDDTQRLVLETMEEYDSYRSTPAGFVENSSDYESMAAGDPSMDDFGNLAELWESEVVLSAAESDTEIKVNVCKKCILSTTILIC